MTKKYKIALLIIANSIVLLTKLFVGNGFGYYTNYNLLSLPFILLFVVVITSSVFYVLVLADYGKYRILKRTIPALWAVMILNQLVFTQRSWIILIAFIIALVVFIYLGIYTATHYNNRYMLKPLVTLAFFVFLNNIGFHLFYTWPLQVLMAEYFVFYRVIILIIIYVTQVISYIKIAHMDIANNSRKTIEYNQ
ncbi:MAG: hypothetical protein K9L26_02315 [Candidatus Izimaplasma sp.]|nr:hypothetical protein [Candidatus Izimaplasma bacterium]